MFKTEQDVKRHKRTQHLGVYRYHCEKCGHGMEKLSYLKSHKCGRIRRINEDRAEYVDHDVKRSKIHREVVAIAAVPVDVAVGREAILESQDMNTEITKFGKCQNIDTSVPTAGSYNMVQKAQTYEVIPRSSAEDIVRAGTVDTEAGTGQQQGQVLQYKYSHAPRIIPVGGGGTVNNVLQPFNNMCWAHEASRPVRQQSVLVSNSNAGDPNYTYVELEPAVYSTMANSSGSVYTYANLGQEAAHHMTISSSPQSIGSNARDIDPSDHSMSCVPQHMAVQQQSEEISTQAAIISQVPLELGEMNETSNDMIS